MELFGVFVDLNLEFQWKSQWSLETLVQQRQELEELRKQIQGALESRSTAILQQLGFVLESSWWVWMVFVVSF